MKFGKEYTNYWSSAVNKSVDGYSGPRFLDSGLRC